MSEEAKQFWSDDFDMDLLKVFTAVPKILKAPDRVLWTVGGTTYGRLNHPTCWNSHGAFLWLEKPNLLRDERGWFNVLGCVSKSEEVECTWLEWLRDQWVHSWGGALIMPHQQPLPPAPQLAFNDIMEDLRGYHKQDCSKQRKEALQWIIRCDSIISKMDRNFNDRAQD